MTITITGTNDAPVAVVDTAAAVEAGGVANGTPGTDPSGNVLTNDTDADVNDTKTVQGAATGTQAGPLVGGLGALSGSFGTLTLAADGSYTYVLDNANPTVQALLAGQILTDTFSYTVVDALGATSTTTLTVTITGSNDTPVAVADTGTAVEAGGIDNGTAGTNPSGNVLTNDTDVDGTANGETKAVQGVATGTPAGPLTGGVGGAGVAGSFGTLTLNADGSYSYAVDNANATVQALQVGQTLTDTFSYTVVDSAGATSTTTLTLTVAGANDAPDLPPGNLAFYNANLGNPVAVFPNITVTDVDSATLTGATVVIAFGRESGDALNFINQSGITGSYNAATGVLTLTGNASLAAYQTALRSVTFDSTTQRIGLRTFSWVVDDGAAASAPATTLMAVFGRIIPHHHHGDNGHHGGGGGGHGHHGGNHDRAIVFDPRPFDFTFNAGRGSAVYTVFAAADLTINPDSTYQIALPLSSIEAPLGGDVVALSVTLLDGSPLPSWLSFNADTGVFAGRLPSGMVASLESYGPASDDNIVTGALPPNAVTNGTTDNGVRPDRLIVRVTATDSRGNISVMTFTIVLRPASQTWNAPSHDGWDRDAARTEHAGLIPPVGQAAWSLDRDAWTRAAASGSAAALVAALDDGSPTALAGRSGLAQQLDRSGWRSMSADRTALLHSLREGAAAWH